MSDVDPFLPLEEFFPGRSSRWCADNARAGRIPGAVKIGGSWMIRASDAAKIGKPTGVPTEEEAAADLRRRGVIF